MTTKIVIPKVVKKPRVQPRCRTIAVPLSAYLKLRKLRLASGHSLGGIVALLASRAEVKS